MSDTSTRRRIRAQNSALDKDVVGFVLDTPLQPGEPIRLDTPNGSPLAKALFAIGGVRRIEISGPTIWVSKSPNSGWTELKPTIAAAIRQVLDETTKPLVTSDAPQDIDPDVALLREVEKLLDRQINPGIAAHGGRISAERVDGGSVYLRMSGGCQGCAASSATLKLGAERILRAALPQISEIVDVTNHAAGNNPFYGRDKGPSPILNRPAPVPANVIVRDGDQFMIDPEYLATKLDMTAEALRKALRIGDVTSVTETGVGVDAGKTRVIVRTTTRVWAAEIRRDGSAQEIRPPRETGVAVDRERELAQRVRSYLTGLAQHQVPVTYGALARALGLLTPGSVRRITRALETTMREDAAAKLPFIAARAVSRGRDGLPGRGFFDLARALSPNAQEGESELEFYVQELRRLNEVTTEQSATGIRSELGAVPKHPLQLR